MERRGIRSHELICPLLDCGKVFSRSCDLICHYNVEVREAQIPDRRQAICVPLMRSSVPPQNRAQRAPREGRVLTQEPAASGLRALLGLTPLRQEQAIIRDRDRNNPPIIKIKAKLKIRLVSASRKLEIYGANDHKSKPEFIPPRHSQVHALCFSLSRS